MSTLSRPSNEMIREILLILFVTCSTLGSQLLIKRAVGQIAARGLQVGKLDWLIAVSTSVPVIAAVLIQGVGFLVWIMVVSRVKLGVAFGISGAFFYVLMAAASWYFYDEKLIPIQWFGLALISSGVLMVTIAGRAAS